MGIENFPAALQPAIQQNYLDREFRDGLQSETAYRRIADREPFKIGIGETLTKTRKGLKSPVETPLDPSTNTNLDNGMSPAGWTVEQYTVTLNMYGDTIDLNTVTSKVGIADQFLANAKTNGVQAGQSLDRLARNALFDAHMGGNTRVRTTLGAAAATVSVDDIRGFANVLVNGKMVAVSSTNPMNVTVGSNVYSLVASTADGTNVSTAPRGISGTLTFATNVTVADGTAGNAVVAAYAPTILRPNSRATSAALTATDYLTMSGLLDAVTILRNNRAPTDGGLYNCYLDPTSGRVLFRDPDFKQLFQGQGAVDEFRMGRVIELADLRLIPTTEAFQQSLGGVNIHRPIIVGGGALIEGDFEGMGETDKIPDAERALIKMIDDVVHVTREPLDRLKQIIAQSWYWIGGFCVPTDATATQAIIPTATASYWKRAVIIEHA